MKKREICFERRTMIDRFALVLWKEVMDLQEKGWTINNDYYDSILRLYNRTKIASIFNKNIRICMTDRPALAIMQELHKKDKETLEVLRYFRKRLL